MGLFFRVAACTLRDMRPLPLRENPLFQQCWRGGSHASWRRWHFSPLTEAALGALLVAGALVAWPEHGLTLGVWLMIVTALASTPVALRQMGASMAGDWRRGRMLDLLMTRLTGADLLRGFLLGEMAGWLVWVPCAAVLSLALVLWGAGEPATLELLPPHSGRGDLILLWLYLLFYAVTQTLWAAGVMASAVTLHRSPGSVQLHGAWVLFLTVPALWLLGCAFGASSAGNWIERTHVFGRLLFFNPWHAGFQAAKAAAGLWLLRRTFRHAHGRLTWLLEDASR